jgi:hypothetical protein
MNVRRLLPVAGAFTVLALAATPGALAVLQTGLALGPNYTVSPTTGVANVPGEAFCTESATATITGTLTQVSTSQTTMITLACGPGQGSPFTLTFAGFHPGPATLQVSITACNSNGCDSSGTNPFRITLRPQR